MEQLTNESLVDVTLSCQGQFVKAHKMVLSACSPYFQDLFNVHQVQHPVIILNGVNFKDLKLVIEFMYRGETRVLESELSGVFSVAEALQIKGLCNVRKKYCKVQTEVESVHPNESSEESQENENFTNDSSDVAAADPMSCLDTPSESTEHGRKRKHTTEVDHSFTSDDTMKVSRVDELPKDKALSQTDSSKPSMRKPPFSSRKRIKVPKPPMFPVITPSLERPAKVYSAKKAVNKKSFESKSSTAESSKDQDEESTEVLPFVQVSLNEADGEGAEDDDIDLTSAIKVNPLFIRDIDDTESSWEDPSRLVIDLPPEESDKRSDNSLSSTVEKSNPPSTQTHRPKLKVRATSELVASSKSSATSSKSSVTASKSSAPAKLSSEPDSALEFDTVSLYQEQQKLLSQLKEKSNNQPPRPPNAFMIFANEWRKKLALENPSESNKQISVRLGLKWKGLEAESKEAYFSASRQATEDHKKKYPGYIYSPKEARLRKALLCSLRNQMHNVPKESNVKSSDGHLKSDNNLGTSATDRAMILIADSNVVVKEELLDDEPGTQNIDEEFLNMVEGGQEESEIKGDGREGNCESIAKNAVEGDQDNGQ